MLPDTPRLLNLDPDGGSIYAPVPSPTDGPERTERRKGANLPPPPPSLAREARNVVRLINGKATHWRYHLAKTYGLTPEQVADKLVAQNGRCAICGQAKRLDVDHDHNTDTFRGMLCGDCNRAIGLLHNTPEYADAAAAYLRAASGR